MKWPLKYQVMVPMTAVMLGVVVALSAVHAYLAAGRATRQITGRIQDVTRTLSNASDRARGLSSDDAARARG